MKKFILILILTLTAVTVLQAQQKKAVKPTQKKQSTKLENEVRQYFFVMLVKGPNRDHDSATSAKIQDGHMANINRLYYEGKIKVAGPFGDDGNWRGIFIFDCASKEEVEALLKTDPAVESGRLAYEVHPWWTEPTGSFVPAKPHKKN
jgi:uncharacterized protein